MGQVLDDWPDLSHNAFRVLMSMARTALDTRSPKGHPGGLYFGGRDQLARALRTGHPDVVQRAIRELVNVGAVVRLHNDGTPLPAGKSSAHSGTRQCYRLTLNRNDKSSPQNFGRGDESSPHLGGPNVTHKGDCTSPPRRDEKPVTGTYPSSGWVAADNWLEGPKLG